MKLITDKERSFWQSPDGKILSTLIHDTNSALGLIKWWHKHKDEVDFNTKTEFTEEVYVIKQLKKIEDAVDLCYTQFKEQYDKNESNTKEND